MRIFILENPDETAYSSVPQDGALSRPEPAITELAAIQRISATARY
jgi:hypothetical protein